MRQNPNPIAPQRAPENVHVGTEARIKILMSRGKNAVLKAEEKKQVLKRLVSNRDSILAIAKRCDSHLLTETSITSHIEEAITKIIPVKPSAMNKMQNDVLSQKFVRLFPLFDMCLKHMNDYEAERTQTRSGHVNPQETTVRKIFEEFGEYSRKTDELLEDVYQEMLKLPTAPPQTKSQREMVWKPELVPQDESLQTCIFCGHKSINSPTENHRVKDHNDDTRHYFRLRMEAWNAHEERVNAGERVPFPKDPKDRTGRTELRRKPVLGKMKSQVLMCMCSRSKCVMPNSDISSTCPILCKKDNGERYPSVGTPSHCSCPNCICPCTARYEVDKIPQITTALQIQAKANAAQKTSQDSTSTSTNNDCCHGLGNLILNSVEAVMQRRYGSGQRNNNNNNNNPTSSSSSTSTSTSRNNNNATNERRLFPSTINQINSNNLSTEQWMEEIGSHLLSLGPDEGLSARDRRSIQNTVNKCTEVVLPSGDNFNTRVIGSTPNQHARNNQLALALALPPPPLPSTGATATSLAQQRINNNSNNVVHPGMIDNLHPDYTNTTPEFNTARDNWLETQAAALRRSSIPEHLTQHQTQDIASPITINLTGESTTTTSSTSKSNNTSEAPQATTPKTGLWKRMKKRNKKRMDFDPELTEEEQQERSEQGLETANFMYENTEKYDFVVDTLVDSDDDLEKLNSQEILDKLERVHMKKKNKKH